MVKILNVLLLSALLCVFAQSFAADIAHERILSFEASTAPMQVVGSGSQLSVSSEHYKHFDNSLKWSWSKPSAQIAVKAPIGFLAQNPDPNDTSVSTFVFWIYMPKAIEGTMRFEFRKAGKACAWFDYGTNFTGWRGAWVAFDRDMQGKAVEGMDEMVITAPDAALGTAFLDHIILSSFQDVRHHTADFQAPYINAETDSHWLVLLRSWNEKLDIAPAARITEEQRVGMDSIRARLVRKLMGTSKGQPIAKLKERYDKLNITANDDGTIKGAPIQFVRYGETYITLGHKNAAKIYAAEGRTLAQSCDLLYDMAVAYNRTKDVAKRGDIERMYIALTRHLLDQGFAAGSAQGTLHHLGYSARNLYTAPVLMWSVLEKNALAEPMQRAMEWFSGVGEIKLAPKVDGMDIDAFNTSLIGRLASIIVLPDTPYKVAYLKAFSRWADNGFRYTEGTSACFKSDGTVFHHRHHYPAYAIGGFDGGVNVVWLLNNTVFAISPQSHANLRRALLEMRYYCNLRSFPLSMSGRHPDGKGSLLPWHYSLLALSGSIDGKQAVDRELASAYMRLVPSSDKQSKAFAAMGIEAEASPTGNKIYGYNSSMSHRRDNWLVSVAGHSRYVWSAEIYQGANHYGRYLTHGALQILADGKPIDSFGSGFSQLGWDWCHIPGTTAAVIPMEKMKADIKNVDTFSGYEEMLLSDETYAGGVSHKGRNGLYAMKLHEHDKYNGTLRARKSFFAFDDRVVALGTGLQNALPESKLHTTLFQNALSSESQPIKVNGVAITQFPYTAELKGRNVIEDNLGNLYLVEGGELHIERTEQHSLHEETDVPTKGIFTKAYINHGDIVKGGEYQYMISVKPDTKKITNYTAKTPYEVLARSDKMHIVRDNATAITGYALFEAGEVGIGALQSVNMPSMVMISQSGDNMTMSVCDPDLRFYDGANDDILDEHGKRVERSIYSRKWIDNPSAESKMEVTVKGRWGVDKGGEWCKARIEGDNTLLTFSCREAATREVELSKVK